MSNNYQSNRANVEAALRRATERTLLTLGSAGSSWVKPLIPTGTQNGGALKQSFDYKVDINQKCVTFGFASEYAIYVEKGTGIYASNGQGRNTPWTYIDDFGRWHITRGQRPQKMLGILEDRQSDLKRLAIETFRLGGGENG